MKKRSQSMRGAFFFALVMVTLICISAIGQMNPVHAESQPQDEAKKVFKQIESDLTSKEKANFEKMSAEQASDRLITIDKKYEVGQTLSEGDAKFIAFQASVSESSEIQKY